MVERPPSLGPLASEPIVAIMRALHLGVEHGYLDPSPHNEAGAGYWAAGPADQPPSALQSAICCCRVEANPQVGGGGGGGVSLGARTTGGGGGRCWGEGREWRGGASGVLPLVMAQRLLCCRWLIRARAI